MVSESFQDAYQIVMATIDGAWRRRLEIEELIAQEKWDREDDGKESLAPPKLFLCLYYVLKENSGDRYARILGAAILINSKGDEIKATLPSGAASCCYEVRESSPVYQRWANRLLSEDEFNEIARELEVEDLRRLAAA
jgi:hypothetical protein